MPSQAGVRQRPCSQYDNEITKGGSQSRARRALRGARRCNSVSSGVLLLAKAFESHRFTVAGGSHGTHESDFERTPLLPCLGASGIRL